MTDEHAIRIGWAGYLRVAVCRCGWKALPRKAQLHAERDAAGHLASAGGSR